MSKKSEFHLENVRVRTLKSLNRIHLLLSMMITFMSLKTEKKNGFFYTVIARARAIKEKDQIKMFLYRFSAGMKAVLEKDSYGIKHFKYTEKPKDSDQSEIKLVL